MPEEKQESLEDEVFGWAANVYEADPKSTPTVDLRQFEVDYSIDKNPATGEESFAYFGVLEK